jgi:rhodanese-related sulfurtransferase
MCSEANFLLIDLRDPQEYSAWHIKEAFNFPLMLVNQDKMSNEMLRYKNKPDKNIIVYSNDERNGVIAARTMSDRGY